jgi:hypothetical protein
MFAVFCVFSAVVFLVPQETAKTIALAEANKNICLCSCFI